MSRHINAGDIHEKLKADGYVVESVRELSNGDFEIDAPAETEARRLEAEQLVNALTDVTGPMTYLEALGRVALGTAGAPARAIVSAEVARLAEARNATRRPRG